jgi:hypothetical protein
MRRTPFDGLYAFVITGCWGPRLLSSRKRFYGRHRRFPGSPFDITIQAFIRVTSFYPALLPWRRMVIFTVPSQVWIFVVPQL